MGSWQRSWDMHEAIEHGKSAFHGPIIGENENLGHGVSDIKAAVINRHC